MVVGISSSVALDVDESSAPHTARLIPYVSVSLEESKVEVMVSVVLFLSHQVRL